MVTATSAPVLEPPVTARKDKIMISLYSSVLLGGICVLSVAIRLFAVAKWGSVIHEFDPQFNFRTTKFLATNSFSDFLNWFDDRAWYPLGRVVGGTLYPGLMLISASAYRILHAIGFPVSILNICVFFAPAFAAATAISTYALTFHVTQRQRTALIASFFMSIVPAYISRSVGGSYDNEGVAIFLLVLVFYLWVRSVDSGSMVDAVATALAYFGMVLSWGGYVFLINVIPIHVLVLVLTGRYTPQLYVAYCTFYILATLFAMQVPFVGFNVIQKAETVGSHGVFCGLQVFAFGKWMLGLLGKHIQQLRVLVQRIGLGIVSFLAVSVLLLQLTGKLQWTGRSLTLLDPTYASKYIPIIASVSEHQPSSWAVFYMAFGPSLVLAPLGTYFLFEQEQITASTMFIMIYATFSWYFAGVMNRLVLTLAPAACIVAAIGISNLLDVLFFYVDRDKHESMTDMTGFPGEDEEVKQDKEAKALHRAQLIARGEDRIFEGEGDDIMGQSIDLLVSTIAFKPIQSPSRKTPGAIRAAAIACSALLLWQLLHSSSIARKAYSSTSLVHERMNRTTWQVTVEDDFREAFGWLRHNSAEDARILSWWDYGYQLSSYANRTVLVDNNTWNNTHIATVGRVFGSTEAEAVPILDSLNVDYVFLLFGGASGYGGDDLDKFAWFLRIAQGVYPDVVDLTRFQVNGYVDAGQSATDAMKACLLYKLSYYQFDEFVSDPSSKVKGYDLNRGSRIRTEPIKLTHFEEVFTSESWIVRIYKVRRNMLT
ncbi:oligosaccharyl transferase stt3 subunit [Aphanomyces cochlioides]|nr:oligosaccharyl transferase stt3 subunit [Aphanomyces cochlioides]